MRDVVHCLPISMIPSGPDHARPATWTATSSIPSTDRHLFSTRSYICTRCGHTASSILVEHVRTFCLSGQRRNAPRTPVAPPRTLWTLRNPRDAPVRLLRRPRPKRTPHAHVIRVVAAPIRDADLCAIAGRQDSGGRRAAAAPEWQGEHGHDALVSVLLLLLRRPGVLARTTAAPQATEKVTSRAGCAPSTTRSWWASAPR